MDNIEGNINTLQHFAEISVLGQGPNYIRALPPAIQSEMNKRLEMNQITNLDQFCAKNNESEYPEIAEYARQMIELLNEKPLLSDQNVLELNKIMNHFGVEISLDQLKELRIFENGPNTLDIIRYLHKLYPNVIRALGLEGVLDSICGKYILSLTTDPEGASTSIEHRDLSEVQTTLNQELIGLQYLLKWLNRNPSWTSEVHIPIAVLVDNGESLKQLIIYYAIQELSNSHPTIGTFEEYIVNRKDLEHKDLTPYVLYCVNKTIQQAKSGQRIQDTKIRQLTRILTALVDNTKIQGRTKVELKHAAKMIHKLNLEYRIKDSIKSSELQSHSVKLEYQRAKSPNRVNRRL